MDELEEALAAAEEDVAAEVRAVLEEVAEEFADALQDATELVAARFSVSRIARMWGQRVPRLVRRLLGVTEQAAQTAAGQVDATLPEGWDDLPGRQDRGEELPEGIGQYVESTEHLLRAVGDRLADVAVRELAAGVDAGEDLQALRARLLAVFQREGAQLGPGRESLISTTEAARAWNTATLAAAQALTGPDRPIVKQWQTRRDSKVRDAHHDVDGFVRLLDDAFEVDGVDMQHPGDPTAPPALVCNCRCILRLQKAAEQRASAYGNQGPLRVHVLASTPPNPRYPGVRFLIAPDRYCYINDGGGHCTCDGTACDEEPAHNAATPYGFEVTHPEGLAAAATEHTGAMIALVPSAADVERLALEDGEPAEELHCTLWFLGTAADWGEDQRRELIDGVRARASSLPGAIRAVGFGVNHWNPSSPDPAWVWAIGDDPEAGDEAATLHEARAVLAQDALEDGHNNPELPRQHTPWVAHTTAVYTTETWPLEAMAARLGPLVFDRVRVAFGNEVTDIPLGKESAGESTPAGDVSASHVRHHGGYATSCNTSSSAPCGSGPDCGCGGAQAERLPADLHHPLQGAPLGDDQRRPGAPGERHPGHLGGFSWTPDRAGGGRTPHLRDAPVRGGDAPGGPGGEGARRPPRGEPGAVDVLSARDAVRPQGPQGMGRVPGVPAGGHQPLAGEEPGQGQGVRGDGGGQGGPPSPGEEAPQHARAQGEGSGLPARQASTPQGAGAARELRSLGGLGKEAPTMDNPTDEAQAAALPVRTWSTPDGTALAFEDTETGDGRIFASGAIYWETGPWPLQYADEMGMGHEGAELAGAIEEPGRDSARITGRGPLYLSQRAGYEVVTLLEQDPPAPLGVSVDLDSVDVEFVDRTLAEGEDGGLVLAASIPYASVMRLEDGGWVINAATEVEATAAGTSLARRQRLAQIITGPDGRLSAAALQAFDGAHLPLRRVSAAAGDSDSDDGVVLHSEQAGDFVIRITKARLRGATLVAMPAFDQARIVLDPPEEPDEERATATAAALTAAASAPGETRQKVIRYVRASPGPVGAAAVGKALGIATSTAAGHLRAAVKDGHLVRLAAGLYVGASTMPEGPETTASTATAAAVADGDDPALNELVASAWTAMRDLPPMPAAWFQEPTEEELPPGSGGVHYAGGRIYGWVAQAGEPHAGFSHRRLTIESLGDIDTTHFLRARFALDDGTFVKIGAFTMNVGHDHDGAECKDVKCQFDNSRTVAGLVTVGMNERGMWFSGAMAPWLSDWDRRVFLGCQPSYHMKKGDNGRWQLRAVLSVPVPGHSSPLLAAAVERGNLALAASAAAVLDSPDTVSGHGPDVSLDSVRRTLADALDLPGQRPDTSSGHGPDNLAALLDNPAFLDGLQAALARRDTERRAEVAALSAAVLAPTTTDPEGDQ